MKQLYLLIFFFSINCFSQDEFITIWNSNSIAPSESITIPLVYSDSSYFYTWQRVDENFNELSPFVLETEVPPGIGSLTINFPTSGLYRLKIFTSATSFSFHQSDVGFLAHDLLRVEQWGNINWSSFNRSFLNCVYMDISATDIPNLEGVKDVTMMFSNCVSLEFNESINDWNVVNIEKFEQMFANAINFNQDIGGWNTQSAKTLKLMFLGANSFNQNIELWNVSNVNNFHGTFHYNSSFNQPLDRWNTINADTVSHMFCGTLKFNQPLTSWNTRKMKDMDWIFNGANKFNQDLSTWKLDSITTGEKFFDFSGMDCNNFTNTLINWQDNPNLASNITFGVAEMKHNSELNPTLIWLTTVKNWDLVGNLYEYPNCTLSNEEFSKINVKIYPNPTSSYFMIEGIYVEKVEIFNYLGQLVHSENENSNISIEHLKPGSYLIKINDSIYDKIIKK